MSYLNTPRLTFSGQFQADPSTVNNDPTHFNNTTFKPEFQHYSTADEQNGWWNPDGTGNWRFIGCKITSVTYEDGTSTNDPLLDPIIGMSIMDTESRTAGKIVDLDSQQQSVSELWGLIVRIVGQDGINMMKGEYEVAPFTNLWFSRSVDQTRDGAAAALYQSIVKNITWNKGYSNSRYLNELREVSPDQLSIQFTVDRYNGNNTAPDFTIGRIVGGIGPQAKDEPKHFVLGRQLSPNPLPQNLPQGASPNIMFATAIVDERLKQVVLDFSNSLQFSTGGIVQESRDLRLAINTSDSNQTSYVEIGKIQYAAQDWYMGTSGICTFPLTDDQLNAALQHPLVILSAITTPNDVFTTQNSTTYKKVMVEQQHYVRADKFVFRKNPPKELCEVEFYVTNLGKLFDATIDIQDATQALLNTPPNTGWPNIGTPPVSNVFANGGVVIVDCYETGKAKFTFTPNDPGNPRVYIDGQIYGLSYNLSQQDFATECNQSNFLSLLIFTGPTTSEIVPGWDDFIQPIMQQYANLYPLMSKGIFNLADKKVVDANAQILKLVFSKDVHDPNYMPATRDLSDYKKKVIIDYLQRVIDNQ